MSGEWSLPALHDVFADVVGDRDMLVWEGTRRTYAEVAARSRGLAGHLVNESIGVDRERDLLARWECGQAPVAIVMNNRPEYIESMLGCYRSRSVPFNVNHHYRPGEIRSLFDMVGARSVIYQRSFAGLVGEAVGDRPVVLIDVDDGSGVAPLEGSVGFEEAVAAGAGVRLPVPVGDDLVLVCTGGTTGAPKGVLWRQADIFVAAMGGVEGCTADSLRASADGEAEVWFPAPPLMHAAAQWTAFSGLHKGATIVLHDDAERFEHATAILGTAERERVNLISIVGDAYARPLVDELRRKDYDLTSLVRIGTGGATTSLEAKEALTELIPHVMIVDGYGASETGGMAYGAMIRGSAPRGLAPSAGAFVLSADRSRFLEPGDEEIGWTARRGRVPLGYLNDRTATESTFPIVDGQRAAVPGDRAQLEADGSIRMLGRDSMVVNTGGEKVFVEEVEQVLLRHPAVVDALVVGRPSERFGQEVVAVVQIRSGADTTGEALRDHCAASLARFKAPRAVFVAEQIRRHPTGKPDYMWARSVAGGAALIVSTEH